MLLPRGEQASTKTYAIKYVPQVLRMATKRTGELTDKTHLYGMPPTNNHAEQAFRLPVIFRKISFGSRSCHGASALATNLSLLSTAKKQKRNPVELFHTVFLKGQHTPLDALYHPEAIPKIDTS